MFDKEEIDKWFQEKFWKDYSIHRPDHTDTPGLNPNIGPPEHPMCRSNIIPLKPARIMVFMPDVTKALIQEYIKECKGLMIWIN